MASTEEVLKALQNAKITTLAATEPEELVIDAESRTITVPSSERLFGVTGDKDVERKYFQCPKIVGDNIDLSQHQIYISYVFTTSENNTIFPTIGNGRYHCEDVEVSGDNITFSWLLSGNVLSNPGFIAFKVMAMKNEGDELKTKWNTAPAFGTVLITVPDGEDIAEEYPDVINQIFDRLDALESGGGGGTGGTTNYNNLSNKPQLNGVTLEGNKTLDQVGVLAKNQGASNSGKFLSVGSDGNVVPADAPSGGTVDPEQIKQAVNGYLEENPVSGMTAEQEQQLNQNTSDVTDLKSALEQKGLPAGGTTGQVLAKKTNNDYDVEWKDEKTGTGLSAEAIDKLEEVGNYLVYTTADGGSKWMELISILRNSSSGGGSGETVTLQSISATYAGGEVAVGTSLDSLTGITVTAHYSDGSTDTITGYTLSGEIVEGKNTITVSYGGKTTTFTVTGVAESGGEEVAVTDLGSNNMKWYSDDGDTLLQQMTKAKSYTGVFEEETEVQVAVIVNETQYSGFYIGAYDGTDVDTGYYAKKFEISGYPSAGKTYTTTYTVPSGYGVIVGGWSAKGNVTVKVVKIGV